MYNFKETESKWQKAWEENKLFEANIENKEKFFLTFPYPYINLSPHIGHFYTIMRVEAFARYKRLKGFNVLFPQGWHCTGSPIVAAANRVKENEPKIIESLKKEGFSDEEIKNFVEPEHWIKVFSKKWRDDLTEMGLSIDWRRNFITTSLNPYYDRFIQWQFRKLKEKGYIAKGRHPVVWDPKTNMPVGDHDRIKGEGETPQEFTLLKFRFEDGYIVAATLRPETVFGQTNLWVGPKQEYVKAKVNGENWIISRECAEKLKHQDKQVQILEEVDGIDLIGKYVRAPAVNREIIILPSNFCSPDKGTGIVTSVPSDAPDDYIGLRDLWENKAEVQRYGMDYEKIKNIEIIPIIDSKDLGNKAAVKIVEDMKIKSQNEREKLEEAKKIVYKKGFYEGVMNKNTGIYAGQKVEVAKEQVKNQLLKNREADLFYELTGEVTSRGLTKCIVKVVSDQWFIKYGDENWKKQVHGALKDVSLYPEDSREQFDHVIDWIGDWACTREYGLGTRLPFDEKWLIESLSDSTIYMAYYTTAHLIKQLKIEDVNDELFDYVFLNKGKGKNEWVKLRAEFEYWYPLDFRNSGKDLVQNHLTFFLFNHAAIFPKENWPKAIGVNGWVKVDGQKMSKSLGNAMPLKEVCNKYGADASRLTILNGGEGLDDPNWDSAFAQSLNAKFENTGNLIIEHYGKGRENMASVDMLTESLLNKIIMDATKYMEETAFRSAIQQIFFDLSGLMKMYLTKTQGNPNKEVFSRMAESYTIMMLPFTPHISEELWHKIGNEGFVSLEKWPEYDKSKIDESLEILNEMVENAKSDINAILKLVKTTPSKITLVVSSKWKYEFFKDLKAQLESTRDMKTLMGNLMNKEHKDEIPKLVQSAIKNPGIVPALVLEQDSEYNALDDMRDHIGREFKLLVEVEKEESSRHAKAKNALPGKPAIVIS